MFAIYKKELKTYFNSMLGWVFLAATLFFSGWYFRMYGLMEGYPYVSYVISGCMLIFLFSMPILSMRIFSEELKQRTDQLLYTSPISVWQIILGKYLSLVTIFAIPVLVMCVYPLIMRLYGQVPLAENYLSLFGFFLFGITCLAIGLFISSLTDNQIIAAAITFFVLLSMVMISGICNLISQTGNFFTSFLSLFDISTYLNYFLNGTLYAPAFVYYLSTIALCLYLTGYIILRKRWHFGSGAVARITGNILGLVLTIVIVIGVNVLFQKIPEQYVTKDFTYNSIYSLTKETKEYLNTTEGDITIYYIVDTANIDKTVETTLNNVAQYSDNITLKYISPTENPYFYADYSDTNLADNSIVVVCNDKYKVVDYYNFFVIQYDYQYNIEQGQYVATNYSVKGYDGEGRVMAAIDYVSSDRIDKVYCISGHDELEMEKTLTERFEKANILHESINLLTYDEVPLDASAILILGPLSDYSDDEVTKIQNYLDKGGNLICLVAYTDAEELTNYYSILKNYNISVQPGLVMEQGSSYYNSQPYYLLPDILDTEITENVYSNLRTKYVYMPFCKGMLIEENYPDVSVTPLMQTTQSAYALDDLSSETEAKIERQYYLGVYAEKNSGNITSRLVAFASDYFLYEDINSAVGGNNYDVFMKALNTVLGENEVSIIPAKNYAYDRIIVDQMASTFISIFIIFVIPVFFLVVGVTITIGRRKK